MKIDAKTKTLKNLLVIIFFVSFIISGNSYIKGQQSQPKITSPVDLKDTISPLSRKYKSAEYEGGMAAFQRDFYDIFDVNNVYVAQLDSTVQMVQTVLSFVIEKDGSLSEIKSNGAWQPLNNEAIRALKVLDRAKKWTPAETNGKVIRSNYRFPVRVKLR